MDIADMSVKKAEEIIFFIMPILWYKKKDNLKNK